MTDTRKASTSSTKGSSEDYHEVTHAAASIEGQSQVNTGESEPASNTIVFAGQADAQGSAHVVVNAAKIRTLKLIRDLKE